MVLQRSPSPSSMDVPGDPEKVRMVPPGTSRSPCSYSYTQGIAAEKSLLHTGKKKKIKKKIQTKQNMNPFPQEGDKK